MFSFSENYQLRKYYLQEEQVPSQSMMKQKMSPNMAAILFKFLNPKLKVLAGLEPPLIGGGSDWYVCPKEILEEKRAILKPLDRDHLTKLNHSGIARFRMQILTAHHEDMENEKKKSLLKSDEVWKETIKIEAQKYWDENVELQSKNNTEFIKHAFDTFSRMYRTSLNNIEMVLHEEVIKYIKTTQDVTRLKMKNRYDTLLKYQAMSLTNQITPKFEREKARFKAEFIEKLEKNRTEMINKVHDLNVDKHVAVEKSRRFLKCQKLACQIYVSLKEKEECLKEMKESKHKHKKSVKFLTENSALKGFEVSLAEKKDKKLQELNSIWRKKVTEVVKKFQMFVSYSLNILPDHAEFFINMEKLLLLQVNESLEDPTAESIIAAEEEQFHTPVPQPKPFYLFCDKGYKAQVDQELCPKHSGTSSDLQLLPAIIINKRCLYAACDNFKQFTNKIKDFIHGNRGDDADIKDDLIYEHFVPVKYTPSQQLFELKLESSLLHVLQQEMSNIKGVPIDVCAGCDTPNCLCTQVAKTTTSLSDRITKEHLLLSPSTNKRANPLASKTRLEHEHGSNLESYMRYSKPKKCDCAKSCKRHLAEHLPVYMRNMSMYDTPELPNYEMCSVQTLKKLVKQAKGQRTPPIVTNPSKTTKDMCTQYSDEEFNFLCTCFSRSNTNFTGRMSQSVARTDDQFGLENISPSYMTSKPSSFAIDRAYSLRQLIDDSPELIEIFNKNMKK